MNPVGAHADEAAAPQGTRIEGERRAARDARRSLPVLTPSAAPSQRVVGDTRPEPPIRGQRLFEAGDRLLLRADAFVSRVLPPAWNPLAQTGAIANVTFLVAIASGIVLLLWYSPSVHHAWQSLDDMRASPWTAELTRSIHRYSSDACVLFMLVHAAQLVFARRFTGARWLAWVTGIALVGLLWFIGWTGYWLVWDERAQLVALGTARLLDVLPIFADPLSRSFLTDRSVNSLLFFVVFFIHMLVPIAMAVALWLHITRLNRPRFLTPSPMTWWIVVSLVVVSLLFPVQSAAPARMAVPPGALTLDAWFLLPLALTDRLGSGALWALVLLGGAAAFSVPFWISRGRARTAEVEEASCNGCRQCAEDCPYDAISMVPRTDGRAWDSVARVDPSRCVGCGICVGSCNPAGITLPQLSAVEQRRLVDRWVENAQAGGAPAAVAFVCGSAAGASLRVDDEGRSASLPGWRVVPVPCSGWVHPLNIERALRHGADRVLVVGCGHGEVNYREGAQWTEQRLAGAREPQLRRDKADASRVRFLRLDQTRLGELKEEARRFLEGAAAVAPRPRGPVARVAAGVALTALFAGAMLLGADASYRAPGLAHPELVVSFKHPGRAGESCRPATPEELASQPPHMRRTTICDRGRASVRLRVVVDGEPILLRAYAPRGLAADGNSVAMEHLPVPEGKHRVEVSIGDSADPDEWTFTDVREIELAAGSRSVVLFDRLSGFHWE